MAIGQESEGRGIGGFMQRSQKQWEQQRMIDAQEEMRRQREMQAEEAKKSESGGQEQKKDSKPASQNGTNTPSSSIASIGSNALTLPASARAGAGVGGATPVSFGSNSMTMYKALTDLGVKPEVAAGAVGSMMGESGKHLNPAAYNPNDRGKPSGGALQWRDDRLHGLYNFAGTSDIRQIPIETQAKWMQQELLGKENGALQSLLKGNTVADGARSWTYDFERPKDKPGETARRTPMGEQFWSSVQNGSVASNTPGSRNRDAGNARSPVQVAANTTTMTDASPARSPQPGAATTPTTTGGATPPSATPSAATSTTTGVTSNPGADAPLPPRRPDDLGGVPLPPRRPDDLGQTAQPATAPPQPAQQDEAGGFLKDIGSFFSGEPIRDKNGREWDALYGFEKPPGEIAAASQRSNEAAKASDAPSMLERSSASTATAADSSKSIFSDMPDIGAAFSPAFNFFSSIFG